MAEATVNDHRPSRVDSSVYEALITGVGILLVGLLFYSGMQRKTSENAARIEASCQTRGMTRLKSPDSALCVDAKGQVFAPSEVEWRELWLPLPSQHK